MNEAEKITQALHENNMHYCEKCKKKQPVELTKFDPDIDNEPDLIVCLICSEAIGFIEAL